MRKLIFLSDARGSLVPRFAVICGSISLACVAGAWSLDQMTHPGGAGILSSTAFRSIAAGRTMLSQTTVDYTPTGAIPNNLAAPVVLDPCTGAQKN